SNFVTDWIEVEHDVIFVHVGSNHLIAQTEIQSETRGELPIILKEISLLPIVHVHVGSRCINESDSRWRQTQGEIGKPIDCGREARRGLAAGLIVGNIVGHAAARVAAASCKAIQSYVAYYVSAHF